MKVYNTRPSQFCYLRFLFFRPLSSVHLFQSNHRFQAIEFVDQHVSEKLLIQSFLSFLRKNIRGFDHAKILSPSSHGLRKERLAQWPPICVQNAMKSALQIMSLAAYASETNNNVFCMQFDQNEHFSSFEFSSAGIKIGVWINSAGLNSLGRPQFELGSAHEKFGVWTGPKTLAVKLLTMLIG